MSKVHKIGTRFKTDYAPGRFGGSVLEVTGYRENSQYNYSVKLVSKGSGYEPLGYTGVWRDDGGGDMQIITSKNIMSKVGIMMKKLVDKDTQTLVKAGLINGDLELTSLGQSAILSILFLANKDELVKVALDIIKEAEANQN